MEPTGAFTSEPASQITQVIHVGKTLSFNNADDFKHACLGKVAAGARHFILDFSETGILDSTGLGAIFLLYRKVSPLEGEVVFAALTVPVQMVIQLSRISRKFRIYPTVAAARKAMA